VNNNFRYKFSLYLDSTDRKYFIMNTNFSQTYIPTAGAWPNMLLVVSQGQQKMHVNIWIDRPNHIICDSVDVDPWPPLGYACMTMCGQRRSLSISRPNVASNFTFVCVSKIPIITKAAAYFVRAGLLTLHHQW
jgi:hypothetical protein